MERAVVVAMPVVDMVEVAVHEKVDVVAMGDGFMPTICAVLVAGLVGIAGVVGRALGRVGGVDLKAVLVHMVSMRVVEMTGRPGDIVLWDPRALHTASNSVGCRPRSVIRFRLEHVPNRSY